MGRPHLLLILDDDYDMGWFDNLESAAYMLKGVAGVEVLENKPAPPGEESGVVAWEDTQRGFARGEFKDRYGAACSVQDSSLAGEACIWLGTNRPMVKFCVPGEGWTELSENDISPLIQKHVNPRAGDVSIQPSRMHLTKEHARDPAPSQERPLSSIPWQRNRRVTHTGNQGSLLTRTYTPPGKLWPRVSISVWRGLLKQSGTVRVTATIKQRPQQWWQRYGIPGCLISEAAEMLLEVQELL